jgi:hypothetical protein
VDGAGERRRSGPVLACRPGWPHPGKIRRPHSGVSRSLHPGTLEPGKRADQLVLDADPLDDIANTGKICAVNFAGRAVDRAAPRATWADKAAG